MSNERGMAKEYFKFFLDRIEVNDRRINLVANTVALCNFSLMKKTGETADVLTAVPPVVIGWLARLVNCKNLSDSFQYKSKPLKTKSFSKVKKKSPPRPHPFISLKSSKIK